MKTQIAIRASAIGLIVGFWVTSAGAQSRETVTTSTPNRSLLDSGLFALGVPYGISVVVAATSEHAGDNHLYVPVAGPWMDVGNRGSCGGAGQTTCNAETTYKITLAADGVLQGVGALEIVGAFLFPESTVTTATEPHIAFSSGLIGTTGYGVAALGRF
jgi:hypothetical protein